MSGLSLGVIAQSRKENEHRLPIHPAHFDRIDPDLRSARSTSSTATASGSASRTSSWHRTWPGCAAAPGSPRNATSILLAKPLAADLATLHEGQVLWGWPHCVQSTEITQLAIDRRLTLIAFEAMNHWTADGGFSLHVFHKNNELAGYCSVLHALQLIGTTGVYGRRLRARVIGFGATGRGAVTALTAHGVHSVHILTNRGVTAVASPIHSARIIQFEHEPGDAGRSYTRYEGRRMPLAPFLAEHDIVVNCVLQNPDAAPDLRDPRRPGGLRAGQPHRRRVLRRGNGVRLGPAHIVRGADVHGGRQRALLRGRPQPVDAVELGDLGDQRGPPPPSAHRARRPARPGTRIRRSDGPSRSATGSSRTPASCPSSIVRPGIRTRSDNGPVLK